jgi:hypothetical protein
MPTTGKLVSDAAFIFGLFGVGFSVASVVGFDAEVDAPSGSRFFFLGMTVFLAV